MLQSPTPPDNSEPDFNPPAAGAWRPFDAWIRACGQSNRKRERLSEKSAAKYRTVWNGYLQWLGKTQTDWTQASPEDISAYVQSLGSSRTSPASKVRSRSAIGASPVTQHRYWRVLRDVYSHAVIRNDVLQNPCTDAQQVPTSESMASMVLPSWTLTALQRAILMERKNDPTRSWQTLRNDALILLLCHSALKVSEIQSLRLGQLIAVESARSGSHLVLAMEGSRKNQSRQIPLHDAQLLGVLRHWLMERGTVTGGTDLVFFSKKFRPGTRERSALTAKSIFLIVNEAIARYIGPDAFEFNLAHAGPETVRNTVITRWLGQGRDLEEVMLLTGLAEKRALLRLMAGQTTVC